MSKNAYWRRKFKALQPVVRDGEESFDFATSLDLFGSVHELSAVEKTTYDLEGVDDILIIEVMRTAATERVATDWRVELLGENYRVRRIEVKPTSNRILRFFCKKGM